MQITKRFSREQTNPQRTYSVFRSFLVGSDLNLLFSDLSYSKKVCVLFVLNFSVYAAISTLCSTLI